MFVVAVCLLQLGAALSYALKRQYAQAAMFGGAMIANGAALFLPVRN